ncbi:MAG TPA: CoA ester lyase [Terriglobales bacterium]|nr:CoA ester lyase [Terriglobales bacterium]
MEDSTPLRRSLLFVPASEPRKLERASTSEADTLILDLEDAVPPAQKAEARRRMIALVQSGGHGRSELVVRVNSLGSPAFQDDLEAVVEAGVTTILLPKADSAESVEFVVRKLEQVEGDAEREQQVRIIALVESALGIVNAAALGRSTPRLDALCFGHVDFASDMGLPHAESSHGVVLQARCTVAIAAKASGLGAIDCVCLAIKDEMAFREDAVLGAQLGYDGKLCVHPSQVRFANEVYTPTPEQVEYAARVIAGWRSAQSAGHAVFTIEGKMIDAPVVASQERILARARRAGVGDDEL